MVFLVDHEPPYLFKTKLSEDGIQFEKDEDVEVFDVGAGKVVLEKMEDTVHFEIEQFNRRVITESFNRAILTELVQYIDPSSKEKNAHFCCNESTCGSNCAFVKRSLSGAW